MKTYERFVSVGGETIFVRHTDLRTGRPNLFFVHGLGESSLSFAEAFSGGRLAGFNLIAPDNVGYGRSSRASNGDYSFAAQVRRLKAVVDMLGLDEIILVGHSLGGILGTLWAAGEKTGHIRALVNVEGNLTEAGTLFSRRAADAFNGLGRGLSRWSKWFLSEFTENDILGRLGTRSSIKRYYASLLFARPEAFLANSLEIIERAAPLRKTDRMKSETPIDLSISQGSITGGGKPVRSDEGLSGKCRAFEPGVFRSGPLADDRCVR